MRLHRMGKYHFESAHANLIFSHLIVSYYAAMDTPWMAQTNRSGSQCSWNFAIKTTPDR